ncbi:P-loop containing nucleoside triphosphate hydrolase protein [Xylaria curta]|nr:P-loop containing nucleoside triphosphate hydrolase protein [Xylaria curta]
MDNTAVPGFDRLSASDIIIAVLGITGSGKSTFISSLTGSDTEIGHNLRPKTAHIGIYSYVQESGRRVYLIDTPGFDDDIRTDIDVLQEQIFLFAQLYKFSAPLVGVIYLHSICKNRIGGSTMRNFRMLEQMCGFHAVHRIVLVTTMWNTIQPGSLQHSNARERQMELITDEKFWGYMCRQGSQALQFDGGKESALQAIDALVHRHIQDGPITFQIQREIVDEGKDVWACSAARQIAQELIRVNEDCGRTIDQLSIQLTQAERQSDRDRTLRIAEERRAFERRLQDVQKANEQLQTSFQIICGGKEARFAHMLNETNNEYSLLTQELRRDATKYTRLEQEEEESKTIYESYLSEREETHSQTQNSYNKSFEKSCAEDQQRIQEDKIKIEKSMKAKKRKKIVIQNIVPMLQILGGIAAVTSGAIVMIPPVAALGASLLVAGTSGLSFSTKKKEKTTPSETVDE